MVSDADVESYKQIKSDLDVLRQSVEKSELWVYKSSKPASTITPTANQQQHVGGEEHQSQEQASSIAQVTTTDVTSAVKTPTINTVETLSSQPLKDTNSTTTDPSTTATDKVLDDTSATDGGNGDEEEEDDEYRKIKKVPSNMVFYL